MEFPDVKSMDDDELNNHISGLEGAMSKDASQDEAPSFANSLGSELKSIGRGIAYSPVKVAYNIESTLLSLQNGLGLKDDETYKADQAAADKKMNDMLTMDIVSQVKNNSLDFDKYATLQPNKDVQNFPTANKIANTAGSFALEAAALGGPVNELIGAAVGAKYLKDAPGALAAAGRIGQSAIQQGTQMGAISGLEGEPGHKAEDALMGFGVGAAAQVPLSAASELLNKGITGARAASQIEANTQKALETEAMTGMNMSIAQKMGKESSPEYTRAVEAINKNTLSPMGFTDETVKVAPIKEFKGDVLTSLNSQLKESQLTSSKAYDVWKEEARIKMGAMSAPVENIQSVMEVLPKNIKMLLPENTRKLLMKNNISPADVLQIKQDVSETIYSITGKGFNKTLEEGRAISPLRELSKAANKDLNSVARMTDTHGLYTKAEDMYKNTVAPLKDIGVKTELSDNKFWPILNALSDPLQKGAAEKVLKGLGDDGIDQVKKSLVANAAQKSLVNEQLDPNTFIKEYRKTVNNYGFAFTEQDKALAQGYSNIINLSGKLAQNMKAADYGEAINAVTKPIKVIINAGLNHFSGSKLGQAVLTAAAKLPSGSPEHYQVANAILRIGDSAIKYGLMKTMILSEDKRKQEQQIVNEQTQGTPDGNSN